MFTIGRKDELREVIQQTVESAVQSAQERIKRDLRGLEKVTALSDRIVTMKEQIEDLRIQKSRREEEFEKREREIEHKVGLERKRQEFEVEHAKREALVAVREENLRAQQEAFEERMTFMTERFEKEVKYQRKLLERMMERLPTAEIIANAGVGSGG